MMSVTPHPSIIDLAVAASQEQFDELIKHFDGPRGLQWVNDDAAATTHTFHQEDEYETRVAKTKHGEIAFQPGIRCIVGIRPQLFQQMDAHAVGVLVHEACHIWAEHARYFGIGGDDEVFAYGVQSIVELLVREVEKVVERSSGR